MHASLRAPCPGSKKVALERESGNGNANASLTPILA